MSLRLCWVSNSYLKILTFTFMLIVISDHSTSPITDSIRIQGDATVIKQGL